MREPFGERTATPAPVPPCKNAPPRRSAPCGPAPAKKSRYIRAVMKPSEKRSLRAVERLQGESRYRAVGEPLERRSAAAATRGRPATEPLESR
jgi:hypothetical protein